MVLGQRPAGDRIVTGSGALGRRSAQRGILVLLSALFCGSLACSSPPAEVPAEILGTWTTGAAGFEGRAIEIRSEAIEFANGGDATVSHWVTAVEVGEAADGQRPMVIVYEGEGGNEYRLGVIHDRAEGTLRLRHRGAVEWRRGSGR